MRMRKLTRSSARCIVNKISSKERFVQRWHGLLQTIIQVLRDPAWSGIGGICTLVGIPLSIFLSHRSPTQRRTTSRRAFKKIGERRHFIKYSGRRFQVLPSYNHLILKKSSVGRYLFTRSSHVPASQNVPAC